MLSELESYGEDFVNEMKDFVHILEEEDEGERFSQEDTERLFVALAILTGIRPSALPDAIQEGIALMEAMYPNLADRFVLKHEGKPDLSREAFYGALTHLAMLVDMQDHAQTLLHIFRKAGASGSTPGSSTAQ